MVVRRDPITGRKIEPKEYDAEIIEPKEVKVHGTATFLCVCFGMWACLYGWNGWIWFLVLAWVLS